MNKKKVIIIISLCLLAFYSISITIAFVRDEPRKKSREEIKTEIEKVNKLITNMNDNKEN